MAVELQRSGRDVGANRFRSSLYDRLAIGLESDERLLTEKMYKKHRRLYDKISGVGYLVKENHPDAQLDWVWENALPALQKRADVVVLDKILIARLRLPWSKVDHEWLCTEEELREHGDEYFVIEVFLYVREKGSPEGRGRLIQTINYELEQDRYEVLERRYLVTWKSTVDRDRLENIEAVHTYMSQ